MRQVPAGGQIQPHKRIAWLQQSQEYGLVHLAARTRLDVGEFGAEQLLGALDGERFGLIDELAAAIVPMAWIAFRILVCHYRAGGLKYGARDDIF